MLKSREHVLFSIGSIKGLSVYLCFDCRSEQSTKINRNCLTDPISKHSDYMWIEME